MIRTACVLWVRGWAEVKAMSPSEILRGLHRGGHKRPRSMVRETGRKGLGGTSLWVDFVKNHSFHSVAFCFQNISTLIYTLKIEDNITKHFSDFISLLIIPTFH